MSISFVHSLAETGKFIRQSVLRLFLNPDLDAFEKIGEGLGNYIINSLIGTAVIFGIAYSIFLFS